ncbi:MAG: SIS domain-containing protein [Chloroflexota bacterium]
MTTHLESEIKQQPDVISRLIEREQDTTRAVAAAVREFNPAFVMIAARGTSDNAARYAQYAFGSGVGLPVALATPSLHTLYEAPPRLDRALVIGISQSGQSVDVMQVVTDARQQGALTLTITNDQDSPMAKAAHHHIWLGAGEEQSVAATKTYTASLAAAALLLVELADDKALREQLSLLPEHVRSTIDRILTETGWIERYRYMERFVTLGRGYNYSTAFEINLKVKELCYLIGDAYSEADFRHGPIATIEHGFPVMLVAPQGKTLPAMQDLIERLKAHGAEILVISNDDTTRRAAQKAMSIPALPEWLSPIVAVIPGQVFAWQLAQVRGHEVDRPRGLTKVTVTR